MGFVVRELYNCVEIRGNLFCYVIREVLEAKLLGHYTGISSLETMIAIYIGWQLFGVVGLFLGPIGWILIKEIDKTWNLS